MIRTAVTAAAAILVLGACSSRRPARTVPTIDSDVITHPEIARQIAHAGASSAYDLVKRLRPGWLVSTVNNVRVPVCRDGTEIGDHTIQELQQIPASGVGIIEYLGPNRGLLLCGKASIAIFVKTL